MNRNFYMWIVLTVLLLSKDVLSQNVQEPLKYKVSGILKDSIAQTALDMVTVHLKLQKGNKNVKSQLSQSNGAFEFQNLDTGKYLIEVVGFGYTSKEILFTLDANKNLGTIYLSRQDKELAEVTVVASKPLIKQEIDRLTYDVQTDPESKILNALDMMRKVPLLSLDGEENIQLKGSGNYRVLINGKPSSMITRNPKEVLKSMAAADIDKIEVITTPPAKYDSEGLSGIINIITKKKVDNGYNGNLSLRHRFPAGGPGASASFTVKQGKFGISGYTGVNKNKRPETEGNNKRISLDNNDAIFYQNTFNSGKSEYGYLSTELSYEIDTLNLISGEVGFNGGKWISNNRQYSMNTFPQQSYFLNSDGNNGWNGNNIALNYQHNFKRNKEQLLTFSYRYDSNGNDQSNEVTISEKVNYNVNDYRQYNEGRSTEQTFQIDYLHPVKKLNIEGGVKGILRRNESDFKFSEFSTGENGFVPDPSRSNQFVNDQNVIGFYNSYQYKLAKWGFKAGLRLEKTIIDADFITTSSNLKKDYLNFIPTVAINHSLKNNYNINFGYTQRIERPGIWLLNPFVDRSNPNFISTGNPDLEPVVSNSFDLGLSTYKKASINVSFTYAFANNTIQRVSFLENDITTSTFYNIGKDKSLGTNLNINYPITKKINFNMSGFINYKWIEGYLNNELLKNDGVQGYIYGSASYRLEKGFRLNGSFSYQGPWLTLQGQSSDYYYTSLSVSKDLVKDKLSVSAGINNPFKKFISWDNESSADNFIQTSSSQNYYRSFSFNMNYRFGKLQSGIKKNKRGISNDDVQSGGSGAKGN